jgi:hypothetical protein
MTRPILFSGAVLAALSWPKLYAQTVTGTATGTATETDLGADGRPTEWQKIDIGTTDSSSGGTSSSAVSDTSFWKNWAGLIDEIQGDATLQVLTVEKAP